MSIDWTFVLGATVVIVNALAAAVDILQGGVMWPCLLIVIAGQGLAMLGAWK